MATHEDPTSSGITRIIERISLPLAILVVFSSGLLTFWESQSFAESRQEAQQARRSIATVNELLSELKDGETGQRGFLLTGRERYLEPYSKALENIRRLREQLQRDTSISTEVNRVRRLDTLVAAKLDELKQTIEIGQKQGTEAARQIVLSDRGRTVMDEIRVVVAVMNASVQEHLAAREREIAASTVRVRLFNIAGGILLLSLLLVASRTIGLATARRQTLIHELERSREDASKSRDVLFTTLNSIGDGVIATDAEGRITFLNPVAQNLTGWNDRSAVGVPLPRVFRIVNETTRETVENPVEKVIRLGTIVGLANHTILLSADGREAPIDDSAAPLRDAAGKLIGVVLVFRDVAERRRTELELERNRVELERSNGALRESNADLEHFVYAASHDLQEPLRTVATFSELLARQAPGNADGAEYIGFIQGAVKRMQSLIHALLGFSHIIRGGSQPKTEVSVDGVVGEALWNLQTSIAESGARITCGPLPRLPGHQHHLVQLFQNLIGNAIKYRGECAPDIRIQAAMNDHMEWRFSVEDNGIGIDMRYAENIFGLFQRLHTSDQYPGTGIGLAMCKRIVELHGGRLWVESEPGTGSRFLFTIPTVEAKPAPDAACGTHS